jgi:hypothetical protein
MVPEDRLDAGQSHRELRCSDNGSSDCLGRVSGAFHENPHLVKSGVAWRRAEGLHAIRERLPRRFDERGRYLVRRLDEDRYAF